MDTEYNRSKVHVKNRVAFDTIPYCRLEHHFTIAEAFSILGIPKSFKLIK